MSTQPGDLNEPLPEYPSYTEEEDERLFLFQESDSEDSDSEDSEDSDSEDSEDSDGDSDSEDSDAEDSESEEEIDELESDMEDAEEQQDKLPEAEKVSKVQELGKVMGILVGGWVVSQVLSCFVALARKKPDCAGLNDDQKNQTQLDVNKLAGMSDSGIWQYLTDWVNQNSPDPETEYYDVNFIKKAREKDNPNWKMPPKAELDLVKQLAAFAKDGEMYSFMKLYSYQGKKPDFSSGAKYVLMALVKKYPTLAGK